MSTVNTSQSVGFGLLLFIGAAIFVFSMYRETDGKPLEALRSIFSPRMTMVDKKTEGSLAALRPFGPDDHALGSNSSSITLITYGDMECPFTKEFFGVMQKVMAEYGEDSVTWIFRHFPNNSLHSRAQAEAEAAECAGRVGGKMKFWEYIQAIFAFTKSHNTLDPERLKTIAENLDIPIQAFETCRTSRIFSSRVLKDSENARAIGAQGTPTTVIVPVKGSPSRIDGFASYDEMKAMIERVIYSTQ